MLNRSVMKRLRISRLGRAGFTLIEIMIVLGILGSLMAILFKTICQGQRNAQVKEAKIMINQIGNGLDAFYTDCGFYPTTDQGLQSLLTPPGGGRTCNNWGPEPYLKKMPKDPWGTDLVYTSDGVHYVLKSLGADRKEGGEGVNKDISSEDQ